jgi:hypothetical protein
VTRARGCVGLTLLATFTARIASAQSLPEVTLEGCDAFSLEALRKHLSLELSTLGLSGALPKITLTCSGSAVLIAVGAEPGHDYPSPSRVELADTAPGARERLVALAATELLAQVERRPAPTVPQPSKPPAPLPERKTGAGTEARGHAGPRRFELSVAGTTATFGSPRAMLWGAALGSRIPFGARWSLWLDGRFERGENALSLAEVRWSSGSAFVGLGGTVRAGPLQLSSGLGARAGWLSLSATAAAPNRGQSLTAPWMGVALPLCAAIALEGAVEPFVGAEAGYVTLPVRGMVSDGASLVEHRGAWLSASLGMALRL